MQAIHTILRASTAVTSLLADGADSIMFLQERQGDQAPYVVINGEIEDPNDTQSGQTVNQWNVDIFIISHYLYTSGDNAGAQAIAEAIRNALANVSAGTYGSQQIMKGIIHRRTGPPQLFPEGQPKTQIQQEYIMHEIR